MVPVHVNSLGFRQAGAQSIDCEETWKPLVTVAVAKKRTQQCSLLGCRSVCHAAFSSARDGSQFAYMPASKMRIPTAALRHNSIPTAPWTPRTPTKRLRICPAAQAGRAAGARDTGRAAGPGDTAPTFSPAAWRPGGLSSSGGLRQLQAEGSTRCQPPGFEAQRLYHHDPSCAVTWAGDPETFFTACTGTQRAWITPLRPK